MPGHWGGGGWKGEFLHLQCPWSYVQGPQMTLVTCWSHILMFQMKKQRAVRQKEHWGRGELRRPEKTFKTDLRPFGFCGIYLSRTFSSCCLPSLQCQNNLYIKFVSCPRKWPCELEKQMLKFTEPSWFLVLSHASVSVQNWDQFGQSKGQRYLGLPQSHSLAMRKLG